MVKNETKTPTTTQDAKKVVNEPTYTVAEFTATPKVLECDSADIVKAALSQDGKELYTITEAKNIVKKFKNKEVK